VLAGSGLWLPVWLVVDLVMLGDQAANLDQVVRQNPHPGPDPGSFCAI